MSYFEKDMVYVYANILKLLLKNTFTCFSKWLQIIRTKDMELSYILVLRLSVKINNL